MGCDDVFQLLLKCLDVCSERGLENLRPKKNQETPCIQAFLLAPKNRIRFGNSQSRGHRPYVEERNKRHTDVAGERGERVRSTAGWIHA